MPLVPADNILAMCGIVFLLAWLGFWIDSRPIGRKVAGAVWVLIGAGILSNTGIIALSSPVYDFVGAHLIPLAIPLLLFKANLRRIFRESGAVLGIFFFAALATTLGAILGFWLFDLGGSLGENGAKIAGVYAGGWIGGAMNHVAVSQAVQLPPGDFSVAVSASNPVSILSLMLLLALPTLPLIQRYWPTAYESALESETNAETEGGTPADHQPATGSPGLKPAHVCGGLAISFLICAVSYAVAEAVGLGQYSILLVTILGVAAVNLRPAFFDRIEGAFEMGMILMYLFFAIVGAGTDLSIFLDAALNLFAYGMFILAFHMAFMLAVARLLRFDLAEMIAASGAAFVGPAATAAIMTAKGWRDLVTPAIMCGMLGYVVANFVGVTIAALLG